MTENHTLTNARSSHEQPDVVKGTFDLAGFIFKVRVTPGSDFWQLGFRFAQSPVYRFKRKLGEFDWATEEFRDLYFVAHSDVTNDQGGALICKTSNFEYDTQPDETPLPYAPGSPVTFTLKFISKTNHLYVACQNAEGGYIEFSLPLYKDFHFLHVYGWLYKIFYTLDIQIEQQTLSEYEYDQTPFRVGNVTFRKGDMFNRHVLGKTNMYVLPASSNGSVTPNIYYRSSELGIPLPKQGKPGTLAIYPVNSKNGKYYAGYALSVQNDKSSRTIIEKICEGLDRYNDLDITGINLPLLGTGAGGLDPRNVATLYVGHFNHPTWIVPVIVSVPSGEVFRVLKNRFIEELIPLPAEGFQVKPEHVTELEQLLGITFSDEYFELDDQGQLIRLDLTGEDVYDNISVLTKYQSLSILTLNGANVKDLSFLARLPNLTTLYLSGIGVKDFSFLASLSHLTTLDLSNNNLRELSFLQECNANFTRLYLGYNQISDGKVLSKFKKLVYLDLSGNRFENIDSLRGLTQLSSLTMAQNQLNDVGALDVLKKLTILNVRDNKIEDLSAIMGLSKLRYLTADGNPFLQLKNILVTPAENHLSAVKSFYKRQTAKDKIIIRLPVKVLLLGNHGSGKSSLLEYLQGRDHTKSPDSTHIIQIEQYRINQEKKELPDAILFDFGGQDYYHGFYRAFISSGSFYLILWNEDNNLNKFRRDVKGLFTQDFSLDYWLAQKRYLEKEKNEGLVDSILVIQSFADTHRRVPGITSVNHDIDNEFYVDLKNDFSVPSSSGLTAAVNVQALKYLTASINEMIKGKQPVVEEPSWYQKFLEYILAMQKTDDHKGTALTEIIKYFAYPYTEKEKNLRVYLTQLHRQGMILYYGEEMPDIAWLNPVAVAKYVYERVLTEDMLKTYQGRIPVSEFTNELHNITQLLVCQKVVFEHDVDNEYIVPSFLGVAKKHKATDFLLSFGLTVPAFTLKFEQFIPFGLINQIICFFGKLPQEKMFWRDRLVFVLEEKAKVMINIDFHTMEITVFFDFKVEVLQEERNNFISYLFYGIVGLYWDLRILRFDDYLEFKAGNLTTEMFAPEDKMYRKLQNAEAFRDRVQCQPDDLYISLDGKHFVYYKALCGDDNLATISTFKKDEKGLLAPCPKAIPIYPFQPFTSKKLRKSRTVVISYSKDDLTMVDKFRDYLVPLHQDGLIENPWYCTLLEAGADWNEEIKRHFEESDIIFFMVSENLMKVQYVIDHEITTAIDRYRKFKNVKVVPIIMQPYHWAREGDYSLSQFVGLPYMLAAVTGFTNQHEAWHLISECIRHMLVKELDPGNQEVFSKEIMKLMERIANDKHRN